MDKDTCVEVYCDTLSMTTHSDAKENYNIQNSPIRKSKLLAMFDSTNRNNGVGNGTGTLKMKGESPIVTMPCLSSKTELELFRLSTPSDPGDIIKKLIVNLTYLKSLSVSTVSCDNIKNYDILTIITAYYKIINQLNQLNHRINLNNFKITVIINHCMQMLDKLSESVDTCINTSFDSSL